MLAQLAQLSFAVDGYTLLWFTVCWVVATAFWLWMLVDCLTKERVRSNEKVVWVLVVLFLHVLGAILYFVIGRGSGAVGPTA